MKRIATALLTCTLALPSYADTYSNKQIEQAVSMLVSSFFNKQKAKAQQPQQPTTLENQTYSTNNQPIAIDNKPIEDVSLDYPLDEVASINNKPVQVESVEIEPVENSYPQAQPFVANTEIEPLKPLGYTPARSEPVVIPMPMPMAQTKTTPKVKAKVKTIKPKHKAKPKKVKAKYKAKAKPKKRVKHKKKKINSHAKGATAKCRDGSYSFSKSRRGTCSRHKGVAKWLK